MYAPVPWRFPLDIEMAANNCVSWIALTSEKVGGSGFRCGFETERVMDRPPVSRSEAAVPGVLPTSLSPDAPRGVEVPPCGVDVPVWLGAGFEGPGAPSAWVKSSRELRAVPSAGITAAREWR